jgi:hypothetical protein
MWTTKAASGIRVAAAGTFAALAGWTVTAVGSEEHAVETVLVHLSGLSGWVQILACGTLAEIAEAGGE